MGKVPTIQARAAEKILRAASGHGVTAQSLFQATGLSPEILSHPDNRIPFAQLVLLYETAAALTGDHDFGLHVGENVDPKAFDVMGYSAINSPTLGAALDRVARYNFIWTDGSAVTLETESEVARIFYTYLDPSLTECRQDTEMTFAAIVALGRLVTDAEWSPRSVSFQHNRPRDVTEHERIFRLTPAFNAPANEFVFDAATLSLPLTKADPGLGAVLDRHAEELIARYPRADTLVNQVRMIIKHELNGGDASLDRVAGQLSMSGRSLQRKLREHATSHQELLDQLRKDLAMRYLREPEMAICEVAYLLGFSESSALHRAFKRWTGMTPSEFRGR